MKNLNNLSMTASPQSNMVSVNWTDDANRRLHVWLEIENGQPVRPFRVKLDRSGLNGSKKFALYRNPPSGIGSRDADHFRTQHLEAVSKVHAPVVTEALRRAEAEGMYEAALANHQRTEEDAARARASADAEAARVALRKLFGETEEVNVRHWAGGLVECDDEILLPILYALRRARAA